MEPGMVTGGTGTLGRMLVDQPLTPQLGGGGAQPPAECGRLVHRGHRRVAPRRRARQALADVDTVIRCATDCAAMCATLATS